MNSVESSGDNLASIIGDQDDFIQDHIDSFFPPVDSGEVIEEDRESRSDYSIDYVVDLVDDAVDILAAGFAYVAYNVYENKGII